VGDAHAAVAEARAASGPSAVAVAGASPVASPVVSPLASPAAAVEVLAVAAVATEVAVAVAFATFSADLLAAGDSGSECRGCGRPREKPEAVGRARLLSSP
jgi:hypothetical protein